MSLLSVAIAPRRRLVRPVIQTEVMAEDTLAEMTVGQCARVISVQAEHDPAAARRMFDLGFVPGAEVKMVRKAPLADPVVFRVAGYEIALRREQARWVSVATPAS